MKSALSVSVALALLIVVPPIQADVSNDATVDETGRFVATFPGQTTQNSKISPQGGGKVFNTVYDDGSATYMVSYLDFPDAYIRGHTLYENYGMIIVASLHGPNGTKANLLRNFPYKSGDIFGRECIVDYPEIKTVIRYRLFLLGNRCFQVGYTGPSGTETNDAVTAFLNSFHVLR
jgi:hypothetical protein